VSSLTSFISVDSTLTPNHPSTSNFHDENLHGVVCFAAKNLQADAAFPATAEPCTACARILNSVAIMALDPTILDCRLVAENDANSLTIY
jgi:hypothetical protein